MTSYTGLKEGLFLLDGGASPYASGSCHHPPLMLLVLFPLRHAPELAHFAFIVLCDVATALLLRLAAVHFAAARAKAGAPWREAATRHVAPCEDGGVASAEPSGILSPAFVGLSYLWNPFTVGSCLALSSQNVHHLFLVGAVCFAASGRGGFAAASLALALYVCPFTPLVLVLPCAYLCFSQQPAQLQQWEEEFGDGRTYARSKDGKVADWGFVSYLVRFAVVVVLLFLCLIGASLAAMDGQRHFLRASFTSVITLEDLTPNVGIFWYIFIEVFDRYRTMFLFSFHAHLLFYPIPLHLRIGQYRPVGPWLTCTAAIGIVSVFKPYPLASDFGLMISLMLIQAELIRESEKQFAFLMSGLLFGLCMFPTMTAVWLGRNAGNANFLYNMTLVINIFSSLLLSEWLRAAMKLRRRQHCMSFCREVLLDALDKSLAARGEKES